MLDVTVPLYDGMPYLSVALQGITANSVDDDIRVTGIRLGSLTVPVTASAIIPAAFHQAVSAADPGQRKFVSSGAAFEQVIEFPGRNLQLSAQFLSIGWNLLRLRIQIPAGGEFENQLEAFGLRISSTMVPGVALEGDLRATLTPAGLDVSQSYFKRYEPDAAHLTPMDFVAFHSDDRTFAFRWREPNLNYWLQQLIPNFGEESAPVDREVTLRILFGSPVPEVRLDWQTADRRSFVLPGLTVNLAAQRYSLVLSQEGTQSAPSQLRLIATIATGQALSASSNFAWLRGLDRELQNEPNADSGPPLLQIDFEPRSGEVSTVLIDLDRSLANLPTFFRQLSTPLPALEITNAERSPLTIQSLQTGAWTIRPQFNTRNFVFPFLRTAGQLLQINLPGLPDVVDISDGNFDVRIPIRIEIDVLEFAAEFDAKFRWETFAFEINHDDGIEVYSRGAINPQRHLGLSWRFQGAERSGRQHLFTLATRNFDYRLQQAPGSVIEIDYTEASRDDEPITFSIQDFAVADTGITLTAQVTDRPARLNGLDTRFRFHGSQLVIIDNQIIDFTLMGSGPLPPDLVGDAIADIALQFSQRENGLTLVAGSASLQGEKLLHCQATRFQFSIDGLGLQFVNDGRFHLYFTLTGSAQYAPLASDDANGPLALLGNIQIDLVECPLTGDASVIARHVKFLIELPEPIAFSFLGCFEMEIRSIGFVPQFERFGGDAAMEIGGQLKFAQGTGDVYSAEINFHSLYIGLPAPGRFIPRLYLQELEVNIKLGEVFSLEGAVEFRDEPDEQGFLGEGKLEIPGLPVFAASFAFLRVRQDEEAPWVRAWFIYLEVRQISFYIPYVELYIREIGLGFGYRYTLASIRAADEAGDLAKLIGELRELSRTQGDLSKRDSWSVDLEERGEDPRWTLVARAMISQTSATPGSISLKYLEQAEQFLPCLFLFDAVFAFRSDLTFFMAVRAWLNTNYYGFVNDIGELRERPLLSGFVLLSIRQRRFLAQVSSNPDGSLGNLPPLPAFVESAVRNGQFSATLLIEPGLVHAELGWPNMLRWGQSIGPLEAEISGGMIFRVTKHYLVLGISYKARAGLSFDAELNLRIVGVRISARASVAYGARFIGLIDFNVPKQSALHAGIGLEIRIQVSIALWIKFLFIRKTFRLSLEIGFTAGLEVGFDGVTNPGLRGTGTIFVSAMGRRLQVSVKLGFNESAVQAALDRTAPFLNVGLEATDVDRSIPGVAATQEEARPLSRAAQARVLAQPMAMRRAAFDGDESVSTEFATEILIERAAHFALDALQETPFEAPDYDIFVIRQPDQAGWGYFVLLPRGETSDGQTGIEANGFLPVPPADGVTVESDFSLTVPQGASDGIVIQQFVPPDPDVVESVGRWEGRSPGTHAWKVNWKAAIEQGTNHDENGNPIRDEEGNVAEPASVLLGRYLEYAFKTRPSLDNEGNPILDPEGAPIEEPFADPNPIANREVSLQDERVQNPSEESYESAVRGALEQFRSSPYFKRDPNSAYEQILDQAFRDTTSIYTTTGQSSEVPDGVIAGEEQTNQQAHQLRGLIVQDLIGDLRDYAAAPAESDENATKTGFAVNSSIAFQMGLAFRFRATDAEADLPDWLRTVVPRDQAPAIAQRIGRNSTQPGETRTVRTFNIAAADFRENPPQFQQIQQMSDADTIAIAWKLDWENPPTGDDVSACQRDPEHHLLHYKVQRRSLDGDEPERVYTLKTGEAVHFEERFVVTEQAIASLSNFGIPNEVIEPLRGIQRDTAPTEPDAEPRALSRAEFLEFAPALNTLPDFQLEAVLRQSREGQLTRLAPRFQLVDHFTAETLEDQVALPAEGRSYLYTITPVDFAGNFGRPLTLIATRRPSEPPRVPTDGQFIVSYRLTVDTVRVTTAAALPPLLIPKDKQVTVKWRQPIALRQGPNVPVKTHRLVFRKDATLPIGSYGLGGSTQGSRSRSLPTSNARPLPTDIKIDITPLGPPQDQSAHIPLSVLQEAGVFPLGESPTWRPESWRIFFQTISVNDVPSALAPVRVLLHIEAEGGRGNEERQPAELEWLPRPTMLPLLPPEDQRASVGVSHFPMPVLKDVTQFPRSPLFSDQIVSDTGQFEAIRYDRHPAEIRLIRFRWNQGPSNQPNYPLDLNASYTLLQLDVDAHTTDTFNDPVKLAEVLRPIQEVQMLPAADLVLTPNDTLTSNQWEAWYPSALLRRTTEPRVEGSVIPQTPWYSWRESLLVWPRWDELTEATGDRTEALHPLLQAIIDTLDENPDSLNLVKPNGDPLPTHNVEVQYGPPMQAGDFAAFQQVTAAKVDPYGWNVLQRLGLSVGLILRDEATSDLLTGEALITALQVVINALRSEYETLYPHLHVELLFQPSRSVSPEPANASADSLLAIAQLSLRPIAKPYLRYWAVQVSGPVRSPIELDVTLTKSCSVINQSDPASGQIELEPATGGLPIKLSLTLPLTGKTTLLLRSEQAPSVAIATQPGQENSEPSQENAGEITVGDLEPLDVTDDRTAYFTVPEGLATDFRHTTPESPELRDNEFSVANDPNGARAQWRRFKRYVESINSTDPTQPRIQIPTEESGIAKLLPDFINWSQRFFDFGGEVAELTVKDETDEKKDRTAFINGPGPWLVTAYPRLSTPAYVTPDASGRLNYDHLLDNRWAHNYRYYIRPSSRYELLWRSLLQSPALFPSSRLPESQNNQGLGAIQINLDVGGLDVVIDRTQPVDKPLILASSRLDAASAPGSPAVPGRTWEVIVAQHTEQTLIERNQTLVRQLAYRQIAFTLLRRFAYGDWVTQLGEATETRHTITVQPVENQFPESPTTYPDQPDHISFGQPLEGAIARSLDLPLRIGNFQQGALALQWEALPFFYEHRLLLIAQTASTVSPINETIQRDFEYRAPKPVAIAESTETQWQPVPPFTSGAPDSFSLRTRRIQIPLQPFWESLPPEAQTRWPAEKPDALGAKDDEERLITTRKPASLPDPEVVYQIVEVFGGNVEVQAEFFLNTAIASPRYERRQLGRRFLAEFVVVRSPDATTPQGDYVLDTTLQQITQTELTGTYRQEQVLDNTRFKVAFEERLFSTVGVFKRKDRDNILLGSVPEPQRNELRTALQRGLTEADLQQIFPGPGEATRRQTLWSDFQTLDRLYQSWFSREFVAFPSNLPDLEALRVLLQDLLSPEQLEQLEQLDLIDAVLPDENRLVWSGPLSAEERTALNDLATALQGDDGITEALRNLAAAPADTDITIEPLFLGLERVPGAVQQPEGGQISLSVNDASSRYTGLRWSGLLFDEQVRRLNRWPHMSAFVAAVAQLVATLDALELSRVMPVPRPLQRELPPSIRDRLLIGRDTLTWRGPAPSDAQRQALTNLTGDTDFVISRNTLLAEIDARKTVPMRTRPRQEELPDAIRNQLRILPTQLEWSGPAPTDDQRRALQQQGGDRAFRDARDNLLGDIDRNKVVDDVRYAQPLTVHISFVENNQIQFGSNSIGWNGPAPNDIQRNEFDRLVNNSDTDPAYLNALQKLLEKIDANYQLPMAAALQESDFLPSVRSQLQIGRNQLIWTGPAPTDVQRADLDGLPSRINDEEFLDSLRQLRREIDEDRTVPMVARTDRPRNADLPESLRAQLSLEPEVQPTTVRWRGRLHSLEQLNALRTLDGDPPFLDAIREIISDLQGQVVDQPFDLPVRPQTPGLPETDANRLPPILQDKLLIGRVVLRYHGLMTVAEAQILQRLLNSLPNRAAIARLFESSIQQGLDGSQLQIRTRRGSAAPSPLVDLTARSL